MERSFRDREVVKRKEWSKAVDLMYRTITLWKTDKTYSTFIISVIWKQGSVSDKELEDALAKCSIRILR